MSQPINPSERNIGYVVDIVNEKPGQLTEFDLTLQTRLRHNTKIPLGLRDAKNAIAEAQQRGLIRSGPRNDSVARFYANSEVYYPIPQ